MRLPDEAWADPHMVRAWRTRDFRSVFHLACRHGLTPGVIADVTGLHVDQVMGVMRGNRTIDSAELAASVASGLEMPVEARESAGVPPGKAVPVATPAPKPKRAMSADHPGIRIAELRNDLGWSREYLAERAGVSVPTISKLERQERNPSLEMMRKVAGALGIAVSEIVDPLSLEKSGKRERLPDYLPGELLAQPDFIAACRRGDLGEMFSTAVDAGFTVSHLARRCEMTSGQITAYMRHSRQPSDLAVFARVSDGLHVPGETLGIGTRPWEERPIDATPENVEQPGPLTEIRPSTARRSLPDPDQIEMLRREMNALFNRDSMGDANLEEWERIAVRHAQATRDRAAGILLGDVSQDLAELSSLIPRQRSASALRRLTRVTAQMSGLMCLIFCLLDDRNSFRRWARTASLAGNESGDAETLSWVFAQEAYGHYYSGDITEALDVADRANEVVQVPCAGSALALALAARAHAIMGRDAETRSALARAEAILSQLNGDALIPSAFGYNEASFRFHEGNAYTHLRDVESAMRAQDRALELCSPDNYADWAMTRLDRAQCIIYSGDIASGLSYATETITRLTPDQRRGIIPLRGREIIGALPEGAREQSAGREFRDLLIASAQDREGKS